MEKVLENLINIVKQDSTLALGCTEPVAVGYAANVAKSKIDISKIDEVNVVVSKNIYKNGKFVKIPTTGTYGLDKATAIGIVVEKTDDPMMVFSKINEEVISKAKKLIENGKITLKYEDDTPDVYVSVKIKAGKDTSEAFVENSHTNLSKIIFNDEIVYENKPVETKSDDFFNIKSLSFKELKDIVDRADFNDISFVLEGIDANMQAAREGLFGRGSNVGKTLNELRKRGVLPNSVATNTRMLTASAADTRMSGGNLPIMTSGGSGNQGIGVIIPIYQVGEKEDIDMKRRAKAIFFAHVINRYVKEYSGKLSGMCGCAIASSVGAAAGIAWMLGGTDKEIAGACTNIYANLTGMICDGAKESCSLKLGTSAEEAVIAAYLAVNGVISDKNVGVVGDKIEDTIKNIGNLAKGAFSQVDDMMLEILDK